MNTEEILSCLRDSVRSLRAAELRAQNLASRATQPEIPAAKRPGGYSHIAPRGER